LGGRLRERAAHNVDVDIIAQSDGSTTLRYACNLNDSEISNLIDLDDTSGSRVILGGLGTLYVGLEHNYNFVMTGDNMPVC
jgi:hypothetical protein